MMNNPTREPSRTGLNPPRRPPWCSRQRKNCPRVQASPSSHGRIVIGNAAAWIVLAGSSTRWYARRMAGRKKSAVSSRGGRPAAHPVVGIVMGSASDGPTLRKAAEILVELEVPHELRVVSAHRTPDLMFEYAETAAERGLQVIIAGAGGAAHLPGMLAAKTIVPVLGVPVQSRALSGFDSLLSIVQMPGGVPVGTLAIGESGARNAGLLAAQILALHDDKLRARLAAFRERQTRAARESTPA